MKAIKMVVNELGNVCDNPNICNEDIVELMKDYARQKCKEQRNLRWNNVKDEPLADITTEEKDDGKGTRIIYENFLVNVDMLFAVPRKSGKYAICRGYLDEGANIIECGGEFDHPWCYSLEDVTHWMQIFPPKTEVSSNPL